MMKDVNGGHSSWRKKVIGREQEHMGGGSERLELDVKPHGSKAHQRENGCIRSL